MISDPIKIPAIPAIPARAFGAGSGSLRRVKIAPIRIPDPSAARIWRSCDIVFLVYQNKVLSIPFLSKILNKPIRMFIDLY